MPSAATMTSPTTAAAAVIRIGSQADRASEPFSRPQTQPIRHSTRAYSPMMPLAGGAMSRQNPAAKPAMAPAAGPLVMPSAATTTSTRSGTPPPGRRSPLMNVSWMIRTAASSTADSRKRRMLSPPASGRRCRSCRATRWSPASP